MVISVMQAVLLVARAELLDEVQIDALNQYSNLDYPKKPTLFFESNGTQSWVEEQSQLVGELAGKNGEGSFRWATDEAEREKLWDLDMMPTMQRWLSNRAVRVGLPMFASPFLD